MTDMGLPADMVNADNMSTVVGLTSYDTEATSLFDAVNATVIIPSEIVDHTCMYDQKKEMMLDDNLLQKKMDADKET